MSDGEAEKNENLSVSNDKATQNFSILKKFQWSLLIVTILAVAIGVYYTTLMHDKEGFQTTDLQKGIEIVKEEDHTENLDKENLHTFTSFTNGISEFSSDLYQQSIQNIEGNVVISPLSVVSALGLLSQASTGTTFEEIRKSLHLMGNKTLLADHFYEYFGKLRQGIGKTTLAIFNQIYVQECYEINKTFRDVAEKKFSSGVKTVNFENSIDTAESINQFVQQSTNNKIKNLIKPDALTPDTRAILVNAISFKGIWVNEFDKHKTHTGDFYITDDKTVPVDYMYQETDFKYAKLDDLEAAAVQMGYQGSNFSFIILLPHTIDGLSALETKIKNFNFTKIIDAMQFQWVELTVPKFKIEFDIKLNDALTNLGMTEMFTPKADFRGLLESRPTGEPLYFSNVIHKTFIDINEVGTDAYSVTEHALVTMGSVNITEFRVDHPFFFYIWDDGTKNTIFSGRVTNFLN